jgi:hypothetical protein
MVFPAEPCGIVSTFGWADIVKSADIAEGVTLAELPDGTAKASPVNRMNRENSFIGILKNYAYGTVQLPAAIVGLNVLVVVVTQLTSFFDDSYTGLEVMVNLAHCIPMNLSSGRGLHWSHGVKNHLESSIKWSNCFLVVVPNERPATLQ